MIAFSFIQFINYIQLICPFSSKLGTYSLFSKSFIGWHSKPPLSHSSKAKAPNCIYCITLELTRIGQHILLSTSESVCTNVKIQKI